VTTITCPACGAEKGKKCLTIEPVQAWDGTDLGRVPTLPHRARQRAAGKRS
jgi:hypothetical protein